MDKAIITSFMIVISVVLSVLLFNAVYPAIAESSDAIANIRNRTDERLKSEVSIIHVTGELDSAGLWQDTNSNGTFDVFAWVKNVGSTRLIPVERSDIFFGAEGNFVRIPHEDQAEGQYPYWSSVIENDDQWVPTATLRITIHYDASLSTGRYFFKITAPTGADDDHFFGM